MRAVVEEKPVLESRQCVRTLPAVAAAPSVPPRFRPGRHVYMFADASALVTARSALNTWPAGAHGTLWIVTHDPSDIAALPAVPGVRVVAILHGTSGVDPLVAIARSLPITTPITVWVTGEVHRVTSIVRHFRHGGIAADDIRVAVQVVATPTIGVRTG